MGVRQQTISLYVNGETQPNADVILRIAEYFNVSVDFLLTGLSSKNRKISSQLGLTESSIEYLRRAKKLYSHPEEKQIKTIPYLNELLSDKEFYQFLEGTFIIMLKTLEMWKIWTKRQGSVSPG